MFYPILIVIFLIAFTYRKTVTAKPVVGKPAWYPFRKLIILLTMTIVPILLANWLIPERILATPEEQLDAAKKDGNEHLLIQAHKNLCREHPNDISIHLDYIDALIEHFDYNYLNIVSELEEEIRNPETTVILKAYAQERASMGYEERNNELLEGISTKKPFVNYVKALQLMNRSLQQSNETEELLLTELRVNWQKERTYSTLLKLYERSDSKKLDQLLCDSKATPHFSTSYKNDYYFTHQHPWLYVKNLFQSRLGTVSWLTALAALLVSAVWVVFLRSMDIFNREKWQPIVIVFIGGAIFTFACLPLYDIARLWIDFHLTGEAVNDFFYCFSVIGGSEEIVKLAPWLLFALVTKRLKEPFDYLLYASVAALGFAFTENLMYLEDTGNIVGRTIMSSVGHMFFASIVAYSFILAKYRYKQRLWKIVTPIIGFIVGALAHGFYDFWLISPAVESYSFITILFFIGSLHVWFFFKNNALNNSGFFTSGNAYNSDFQQDLLTFSLLSILMVEYLFVSWEYGADDGNKLIHRSAFMVFMFLIYVSVMLQRFDLKKGVWNKWKFRMPAFSRSIFGMGDDEEVDNSDFVGLKLRLFAPKSNPYIGDKLPKSGVCVQKIILNGTPGWYVFQLNSPINYNNYVNTHVIIKNKFNAQSLDEPKIEIYFLFIPDIFLLEKDDLNVRQFRYAGRAYSMPI